MRGIKAVLLTGAALMTLSGSAYDKMTGHNCGFEDKFENVTQLYGTTVNCHIAKLEANLVDVHLGLGRDVIMDRKDFPLFVPEFFECARSIIRVVGVEKNAFDRAAHTAVVFEKRDVPLKIDDYAFINAPYLESIIFECDVKSIGDEAFADMGQPLSLVVFAGEGQLPQFDVNRLIEAGSEEMVVIVTPDQYECLDMSAGWGRIKNLMTTDDSKSLFPETLEPTFDVNYIGYHDNGDGTVTTTYQTTLFMEGTLFPIRRCWVHPWLKSVRLWVDDMWSHVGSGGLFGEGYGDVVIPETVEHEGRTYAVTTLGCMSFDLDKPMRTLDTGDGIRELEYGSIVRLFPPDSDCAGVAELTLGKSVERIGYKAINCKGLKTLRLRAVAPPSLFSLKSIYNTDLDALTVVVPDGCIGAYRAAPYWCELPGLIEESQWLAGVERNVDGDVIGEVKTTQWYDMQGREVKSPSSGVYVRRDVMNDGRVVTESVEL